MSEVGLRKHAPLRLGEAQYKVDNDGDCLRDY